MRCVLIMDMAATEPLYDLDYVEDPAVEVEADWVFAYGSLIWSPDFRWTERSSAELHGYHRRFCIRSTRYRGTPEAPGLVLGLDLGGRCKGIAFRLSESSRHADLKALYAREMPTRAYHARAVSVNLGDGRKVSALTFVANRRNPQYARYDENRTVRVISSCCGCRGPNVEYAENTVKALQAEGIVDRQLQRIAEALRHPTS